MTWARTDTSTKDSKRECEGCKGAQVGWTHPWGLKGVAMPMWAQEGLVAVKLLALNTTGDLFYVDYYLSDIDVIVSLLATTSTCLPSKVILFVITTFVMPLASVVNLAIVWCACSLFYCCVCLPYSDIYFYIIVTNFLYRHQMPMLKLGKLLR
jgi:hypothetical protein